MMTKEQAIDLIRENAVGEDPTTFLYQLHEKLTWDFYALKKLVEAILVLKDTNCGMPTIRYVNKIYGYILRNLNDHSSTLKMHNISNLRRNSWREVENDLDDFDRAVARFHNNYSDYDCALDPEAYFLKDPSEKKEETSDEDSMLILNTI